jgi:signal transduction histidine kinase
MPRAPANPFLRSTVFRIALLHAGLLALAMIATGLGAWWETRGAVEKAARERITIEANAIADEYRHEGVVEARDAIRSRVERPGSLEYLLIGSNGRILAGDMVGAPRTPGWHRLSLSTSTAGLEGKEEVVILTLALPEGGVLAVGDSLEEAEAMRDAVFGTLFAVGAPALLLGLVLGFIATRRALGRMEQIVTTVRAVEEGNLAARVPRAGPSRDDIDELGLATNSMLDRIATLVATLRRVSAEIAHDLRTPLTRIHHALDKAAGTGFDDSTLTAVRASVDQALRLFDAMLELAEIDSGEARERFVLVDLAHLAEGIVDVYRPEIEASGRSIALMIEKTSPVRGDPDLLMRAITNLTDNALKHSREGASIVVTVAAHDGMAAVTVEDDGPGVSPEDIATMIRPFGRLDSARTTPGNGLGLAIVAGIAQLHGGRLVIRHRNPGLAAAVEVPSSPERI